MADRELSAARIEHDIETLAGPAYTRSDEAIRRYAYTAEYRATLDYFTTALRDLGFEVTEDPVGTLVARNRPPGEKVFGVGSHCDSNRNGGKYDGTMGVVTALEVCRLNADLGLDLPLQLVSFLEEEGSGFGQMLLGSRIMLQRVTEDELPHVLGMSMGTFVAQAMALRAPERVRSLVLVGGGPGGPEHAPIPAETLDTWLANSHLPPPEFVRRTMFLSFSPGWSEAHPELYKELVEARLEHPTPPDCWQAQFAAAGRFLQDGTPVERIAVPVLVVHGDADRVVPSSNGELLARRIPGAELAVLTGRGHVVQLESPDELNRLVEQFLARVDSQ